MKLLHLVGYLYFCQFNSINFLFTNVATQQPYDQLQIIIIIIIIINIAYFLEKAHGLLRNYDKQD
jgi:hypothetical protein